jgi:spore germination protein YaaH
MLKSFAAVIAGFSLGFVLGLLVINKTPDTGLGTLNIDNKTRGAKKEVVGFLPYWLLDKAKDDYSSYLTTLVYFALTIDKDGTIKRSVNSRELEPGYWALTSGAADKFLMTHKDKMKLSLAVFSGDQDDIMSIIGDPRQNALNLVNDVAPIMSKYGFTDLNLDIEGTGFASAEARMKFGEFVANLRNEMDSRKLGTLSVDMIPVDFVRDDHLGDPRQIGRYADRVIIMAYDFHSFGSFVTGPNAPLYGTESVAEFDTNAAVNAAVRTIGAEKILLGVAFYGYSWETIGDFPRAATLPSSGLVMSNKDVADFLAKCMNCAKKFDDSALESYVIYKNEDTGTYSQIFYPDEKSIKYKVDYIKNNNLAGAAIWALGYEDGSDLTQIALIYR